MSFVLLVACASAPTRPAPTGFDSAPWLADYQALLKHLDAAYANLEFAATQIDLPALDRTTRAGLAAARSEEQARAALTRFVEGFRDPHLRIARPHTSGPGPEGEAPVDRALPAAAACAALGYRPAKPSSAPWEASAGFELLGNEPFLHGLLTVRTSRLGVLRLPSFLAQHYPAACVAAWTAASGPCDDTCQTELRHRIEAELVKSALAAIDALAAHHTAALVVDVTRNGGGNDWVEPIARRLSPVEAPCAKTAFVRHPHWDRQLTEELAGIERELARPGLAAGERPRLLARRHLLTRLRRQTRMHCDRRPLWRGQPLKCSGLVQSDDPLLTCEAPGAASENARLSLPVIVLTDGNTASAAEYLVVRLKDYGGARTVGRRTLGAGCGMTNGGIPITLRRSGLTVELPDCVRYRRNGQNERAGIEVDVELPAPGKTGWTVDALLQGLAGTVP